MLWTVLAALALALWTGCVVAVWAAARALPRLRDSDVSGPLPRLSVIVPARDEEAAIRQCLESLVAQDLDDFEVIAVDDRSEDATGQIIDNVAAVSEGRVRPIHVEALPGGWLGKCHALHVGAREATGEFLLFTDGDVIFESHALRRALAHAVERGTDHLLLTPGLIAGTFFEQAALCHWVLSLLLLVHPWHVTNPKSRFYMGIGAFNMVRRSAYERLGGHETFRLHVIDDMALGHLLKSGGSQVCMARGDDLVRVRWQESMWGLVRGLEKNAFAALGYSLPTAIAGIALVAVTVWGPFVGLFVGPLAARLMCFGVVGILQPLAAAIAGRAVGLRGFAWVAMAAGGAVMTAAVVNSAFAAVRRGGVVWRGTFHSLSELRSHAGEFNAKMRALRSETRRQK